MGGSNPTLEPPDRPIKARRQAGVPCGNERLPFFIAYRLRPMSMYLGQVIPYAIEVAQTGVYLLKKSEKQSRKGSTDQSLQVALQAATRFESAAAYVRSYVDQIQDEPETDA